jgi:hypothetical protein
MNTQECKESIPGCTCMMCKLFPNTSGELPMARPATSERWLMRTHEESVQGQAVPCACSDCLK